jgi:peroxiredoxin Q/BCP
VESHARWKRKLGIPYPLLADTEHAVAELYGVWTRKSLLGKTSWGVVRTTFLIDRTGRIARVFPHVKIAGHSREVLEALDRLG